MSSLTSALSSKRYQIGFALVFVVLAVALLARLASHLDLDLRFRWSDNVWIPGSFGVLALTTLVTVEKKIFRFGLAALFAICAIEAGKDEGGKHLANLGTSEQFHSWNTFHYYLGAKYFDELGYEHLYEEALKADQVRGDHFKLVRTIRRMDNYQREDARPVRRQPRLATWTDARWEEFSDDVDTLGSLRGPERWIEPLYDRGYNPSPIWTLVGRTFANLLPIGNHSAQIAIVMLDIIALLFAFGLSIYAYGFQRSALILGGLLLWYGNQGRFFGCFFQYDWLAAIWIAFSAMRLGHPVAAGAFLAYATAVRVFPGAMAIGPAILAIESLIRTKRVPQDGLRLLGAALVTGIVLVILGGLTNAHGFHAYLEFAEKMALHMKTHTVGDRRVGLGHLFLADFQHGLVPDQFGEGRWADMVASQKTLLRVVQLGYLLTFILCVRRLTIHDALILGIVIVFAGATASRYYGASYVFFMLAGAPARVKGDLFLSPSEKRPWTLVVFEVAFFAMLVLHQSLDGREPREAYLFGNALIAVFFLGWMIVVSRVLGQKSESVLTAETTQKAEEPKPDEPSEASTAALSTA